MSEAEQMQLGAQLMRFATPLLEGRFLRRYQRFFAEVEVAGQKLIAHVPNTGSLRGLVEREAPCLVSKSLKPGRKLSYTLECLRSEHSWVGVNTQWPTHLVWELWERSRLPHWVHFDAAQREVQIHAASRLDLALWNSTNSWPSGHKLRASDFLASSDPNPRPVHWIEIKNVTLAEHGCAQFPDCISTRAQKHLLELMKLVEQGHSAEIVYVIQREDCRSFATAHHIDSVYGDLSRQARTKGVLFTPLACALGADAIELTTTPLPYITL